MHDTAAFIKQILLKIINFKNIANFILDRTDKILYNSLDVIIFHNLILIFGGKRNV